MLWPSFPVLCFYLGAKKQRFFLGPQLKWNIPLPAFAMCHGQCGGNPVYTLDHQIIKGHSRVSGIISTLKRRMLMLNYVLILPENPSLVCDENMAPWLLDATQLRLSTAVPPVVPGTGLVKVLAFCVPFCSKLFANNFKLKQKICVSGTENS
jgi:hypothetical protein